MYQHLFGPVPSRRLGMSLGVDLVPHKVCSLNCVYCECGATNRLTRERKEYVPLGEIRDELLHYFSHHPDPDYITFSGAGEPTLHVHMGAILDFIKAHKPDVKVAVITNGTLFSDPAVRSELMGADVVLPSLDAATEDAFRKINRPGKDFTVEDYVEGLIAFSREFKGACWLEVFILPGYNDEEENLEAIGKVIRHMDPEKLQLNTLDRPGVIGGLRAATLEEMERIKRRWGVKETEIVLPKKDLGKHQAYRSDTGAAILETISRRPCTIKDLNQILGLHINEINKYLRGLEAEGRIESVRQDRGVFFQIRKS